MADDKYSVLMSVYKNEKPAYLRESIDSMLAQTRRPDDFVIVCDGPLTADLEKELENYQKKYTDLIQLIRLKENMGLGLALREGLKHCKYDLVARMDADDIAFPDRCEKQIRTIHEKKVQIVSATILEFTEDVTNIITKRVVPESSEEILKRARLRNPFNHNCVMYSKKSVEDAGSYRHCPWFEDYYLWCRMLQQGSKGWNIQEPLLYARAGDEMYQRRGGIRYLKAMLSFKWKQKKTGFYSWKTFFISAGVHTIVCLIPNGMRGFVYKKILHK